MSWLPRRPIFCPIRSRLMVTGLSAITCDLSRNPFSGLGSMVTRKSGASTSSEVSWQITTAAWFSGKSSVCTMTAGLRLRDIHGQAAFDRFEVAHQLFHRVALRGAARNGRYLGPEAAFLRLVHDGLDLHDLLRCFRCEFRSSII